MRLGEGGWVEVESCEIHTGLSDLKLLTCAGHSTPATGFEILTHDVAWHNVK